MISATTFNLYWLNKWSQNAHRCETQLLGYVSVYQYTVYLNIFFVRRKVTRSLMNIYAALMQCCISSSKDYLLQDCAYRLYTHTHTHTSTDSEATLCHLSGRGSSRAAYSRTCLCGSCAGQANMGENKDTGCQAQRLLKHTLCSPQWFCRRSSVLPALSCCSQVRRMCGLYCNVWLNWLTDV